MSETNLTDSESITISSTETETRSGQTHVKFDISEPNIQETDESSIITDDLQVTGDLEKIQNENANLKIKINALLQDLQARTEEKENYKNKVNDLETEVSDLKSQQPNTLSPAQQNAVHKLKKQSEEILTKAKGVIFDKTKLIKHQELQIETLTLQVSSLKEVLDITKELLNIRNLEVKELQEKMDVLAQKISVEKMRHDLMNNKMDAVTKMNTDLKAEYQNQLQLFHDLRETYERREELRNEQQENAP